MSKATTLAQKQAAERELRVRVERLRTTDPGLTQEQAETAAFSESPRLYDALTDAPTRRDRRPAPPQHLIDGQGELAVAVARLRQADPHLTQEQAESRVLQERPELYDAIVNECA